MLCTGRRFRTALPHAQALGLDGAIIVNNGALVKDLASGETLQHAYLPRRAVDEVIAHVRSHGPPLVYLDTYHDGVDAVTERADRAHPFQREYLDDNGAFIALVEDVAHSDRQRVIMVSTMADAASLEKLRREAHERFGDRIQTHSLINKNYQGQILEFLSPTAGKWRALERLAASWGIRRARSRRSATIPTTPSSCAAWGSASRWAMRCRRCARRPRASCAATPRAAPQRRSSRSSRCYEGERDRARRPSSASARRDHSVE